MGDVQKELQKLKALINQRPATAIFSNKSKESDKICHGDAEFYINEMSKKFVFTRAGVKNPITVDPNAKTLENVEYLNGTKVKDLTTNAEKINELREDVDKHEERIVILEEEYTNSAEKITALETHNSQQDKTIEQYGNDIISIKAKSSEQDDRITELEKGESTVKIVNAITQIVENQPLTIQYSTKTEELGVVSYTYGIDSNGYLQMVFKPEITEENLPEGNAVRFLEFILTDSTRIIIDYSKYKMDDGTYRFEWTDQNGKLENGIFTYYHIYEDAEISSANVFIEFIQVREIYNFRDEQLSNAVAESVSEELVCEKTIAYTDFGTLKYDYAYSTGYVYFVFRPAITEENFKEGAHEFGEVKLLWYGSQYYSYKMAYEKVWNGTGYSMTWTNSSVSFENNRLYFRHGKPSNYKYSSATFNASCLQKPMKGKIMKDCLLTTAIVNLIYPVGSLYTSFEPTSPEKVFGVGVWEQIIDKFLYCSDSSGTTGGSAKITTANLPSHTHTVQTHYTSIYPYTPDFSGMVVPAEMYVSIPETTGYLKEITSSSSGSGEDYMPPYITLYAWRRTA